MRILPAKENKSIKLGFATFSMAFSVLTLEIVLIRVFDFILTPNLGYLVVSSAMFCLGLAGVYEGNRSREVNPRIAHLPLLFGAAVCGVRPGLNGLPLDLDKVFQEPFLQLASTLGMFVLLGLPFFLAGLYFSRVFSLYPGRIASLYCWDLVGAALGSFAFLAVFSSIGPGGVLLCAAGVAFLASASLMGKSPVTAFLVALALVAGGIPFAGSSTTFIFFQHQAKGQYLPGGGVKKAQRSGTIEFTAWDPVSRIDVLSSPKEKDMAYDGGTQATTIFPFDADYSRLRSDIPGSTLSHFWNRGVLASHYLMRETGARVLVIGAGAGQEVKAALMYGASRVDAVEMVQTVIDLSRDRYSTYNGGIFGDPRVNLVHGEGRAFVRANDRTYDIIQIYSNHTTSSIASGSGAADTTYLLTVEAFEEYFSHLSIGGLLQINHPVYPRLVTTAAKAWRQLGRGDFRRHVVVWQRDPRRFSDIKPTFLVKMTPWEPKEIQALTAFFTEKGDEAIPWVVAEDPLHTDAGFLPEDFFTGVGDDRLFADSAIRLMPATDDAPFFKFIRKSLGKITLSQQGGVDKATAGWLNSHVTHSIPMDIIHLFLLAGLSVVVAAACVGILLIRRDRSNTWSGRGFVVTYFSFLGIGFIIIEVVFIQKFMKIIGYPVYAFSVVICALLLSAGLGSLFSARLRRHHASSMVWVPFALTILYGVSLQFGFDGLSALLMRTPMTVRLVTSFLLMTPLGFFLGMPFPLGIAAIEHWGRQAIAWAWGMNGLATVTGSLLASVISLFFGFNLALICAFLCYAGALVSFMISGQCKEKTIGTGDDTDGGQETPSIIQETAR